MFNYFRNKKILANFAAPKGTTYIGDEIATREKVDFTSILGYLPDPDEVLLNSGRTFDVYRKIMVDGQVRSCANNRKSGTKSLNWDIERGVKNKSKYGKLIKEFYSQDFDIDSVNDDILNAPFFGFQPIEIIWGRVGKYILPLELKAKNPEWFTFGIDGQLRLLTLGNFVQGIPVPDRKFLVPRYHDIDNKYYNPFGNRILSSCFWPATFKKSGMKWWVTFCEKYGMPYLVGKLPAGMDSERDSMLAQLKNMVMDAVAVISDDSSVELVGSNSGGKDSSGAYKGLIDICNADITKVILGQTLTTEGNSNGSGSLALGKVHAGVRQDIVIGDKKIVENTHNQLIKWTIEANFGSIPGTDIPKYEMFEEEDVDLNLAQRDEILGRCKVNFKKSYFIENYNLKDEDFDLAEEPETTPNTPFATGDKTKNKNSISPEQLAAEKEEQGVEKQAEEFAEQVEHITDQILKQFTDEMLQQQIEGAIRPILKSLKNAQTSEDFLEELNKISPEMNSSEIETQLTKIIFIAKLLGSKDVRDETY
jgi:phage gp29-like protein